MSLSWRRFWDLVSRAAMPIAAISLLLALLLTVYTVESNHNEALNNQSEVQATHRLTECVDRWATKYVTISTERASAHDRVQAALDVLIRAVPTSASPGSAAVFESALQAYIVASNAERVDEYQHPLPPAPTLDC